MRINVLTHGFTTVNGSTFLLPFVVDKNTPKQANSEIKFVKINVPNLAECDVLSIYSKEFRNDWNDTGANAIFELIASYRKSIRLEIATNGQKRYIEQTSGPAAGELFVNHFSKMLVA